MKKGGNFEAPEPTQSELLVRNILRAKKIPFKHGQVIWYTDYEKYTPDLIIGKKLVVEIDGKVHQDKYQKNKDRIRQRALENMGYTVIRVKNEEVQRKPDVTAARIMGEYSELVTSDIKKAIKITELKKPLNYESIPLEIDENLPFWRSCRNYRRM